MHLILLNRGLFVRRELTFEPLDDLLCDLFFHCDNPRRLSLKVSRPDRPRIGGIDQARLDYDVASRLFDAALKNMRCSCRRSKLMRVFRLLTSLLDGPSA